MTDNEYIPTDKLRALTTALSGKRPSEESSRHSLAARLDHVGQNAIMYLPGYTFGDLPEEEKLVREDRWNKIKPKIEGEVALNWMYMAGQFGSDAGNATPTIPKAKIRLLFSIFHYLLDENKEEGQYLRNVVEESFEILGLGKPMEEHELLSNIHQIATLKATPRISLGQ